MSEEAAGPVLFRKKRTEFAYPMLDIEQKYTQLAGKDVYVVIWTTP